ncbi:hypothetical protein JW935_11120 [candidate division KSB1 bacterium]|nr:hypothetical protein [candidate division KSB1 bacterium]
MKKTKVPDAVLQIPEVRKMMEKNSCRGSIPKPKDTADPNTMDDIQITADFTSDPNAVIILKALTPETGLVVSDGLSLAAPQSGYKPQIRIQIPLQEVNTVKKDIYIRARGGEIISQMSLTVSPKDDGFVAKTAIKSNLDGSAEFAPSGFMAAPGTKTWQQQQQRMQKAQEKHDIRNSTAPKDDAVNQ